jgi:pimeloyl-ACP methyl ester carboxylesterase
VSHGALASGTVPVDGAALHYEARGQGHPLVLIHGFFFDHRMWDREVEPLGADFRVVRYDVRGFGRSPLPATPYSDVEDLRALLDHLEIERAHLCGLSMGAGIAIDFTLEHPGRVSALIAVAPGIRGSTPDPALLERIEAIDRIGAGGDHATAARMFVETWIDGPVSPAGPAVRERALALMADYDFVHYRPGAPTEERPAIADAVGRLSAIRAPTLVVAGDRDQPWILENASTLAREIPGARRVTIAGAAHIVNLDRGAELVRLLREFLSGR